MPHELAQQQLAACFAGVLRRRPWPAGAERVADHRQAIVLIQFPDLTRRGQGAPVRGVDRGDRIQRLPVAPAGADVDGVEGDAVAYPVFTEGARLRVPGRRQFVVVGAEERGLAVANERQ